MATAQATTNDLQLGFPPKGSLKRFAFPRLMREVARNKLTGSLYLLNGQTKKVVFFEEGQPVFVRSNVLSECLGQILSSEGLITQEQCEQTLEAIRRTGKKQGELLVEMGILSGGNLRYGLEAQLRAKLYDIFSWEDGRYQFKQEPGNLQFGIRLEMCAEGVIIGAIQDQYSEERANLALQPYSDKYLVLRMGLDVEPSDLALLPEEQFFVESLDGSRTVTQCVTEPFEPAIPTPNALVFGLLQAGVAQLHDRAMEPRAKRASPDLVPKPPPDEKLAPPFEAQDVVTEYEDTPLPGELPKVRGLLGDHEAGFDDVDDDDEGRSPTTRPPGNDVSRPPASRSDAAARASETPEILPREPEAPASASASAEPVPPSTIAPVSRVEVSEELVKAEPDSVEETFDESQIELTEDDEAIEVIDAVEVVDSIPEPAAMRDEPESIEPELLSTPSPFGGDGASRLTAEDLQATFADPVLGAPLPSSTRSTRAPGGAANARVTPELLDADDDLLLDDGPDLLGSDLDDDIDLDPDALLPDVEALEIDPDLEFGGSGHGGNGRPAQGRPTLVQSPSGGDDELMSFDELDAVDLGDGEAAAASNEPYRASQGATNGDDSPEMVGAIRFNEAESALGNGDHARAVALLEEAYDNGFDVAELHAMLAYARFMASGGDLETAQHAFELLDYAQQMDPSLDLVHAYRGAIHKSLGQVAPAREALGRALELNPYCELAIQLLDQL